MINVVPVTSRKLLQQFIMLPYRLYKGDPNWVPPLIMDQKNFFNPQKNPYYKHSAVQLYLALEDGRVIGRISAHSNTQHNLEHKENIGFFGFFECEDNTQAASMLLDAAYKWNKDRGFTSMRGPMNFSVNQEVGLLIDGFDTPPMIMMRHDKEYYQALLEGCGLQKTMDLFAYLSVRNEMPERIDQRWRSPPRDAAECRSGTCPKKRRICAATSRRCLKYTPKPGSTTGAMCP